MASNLLYAEGGNVVVDSFMPDPPISFSEWAGQNNNDAGSLISDPLFRNPTGEDYGFDSGSPAYGLGIGDISQAFGSGNSQYDSYCYIPVSFTASIPLNETVDEAFNETVNDTDNVTRELLQNPDIDSDSSSHVVQDGVAAVSYTHLTLPTK